LQRATVDGKLRIVIARIETTRFAPDLLAEAVGVDRLSGANRDAIKCVKQTEFCEFLDRVWEHVDTDAEFTNTARLLEYRAFNADGVQAQRRREPAYTPANDYVPGQKSFYMLSYCLPSQTRNRACSPP
jgi:hypothetical protein